MIEVHAEFPQREVIQANAVVDNEEKTVSEVIISAKPEITGVTASVDNETGTPYVDVTETGTGIEYSFDLAFHNLKGDRGEQGETGETGQDGFSPSVTVEQTETGATITATDKDGTTSANLYNGADGQDGTDGTDGQDGFSPIATVEPIQDGAKITITDKDGTTTTNVYNGTDGQDGADGQAATITVGTTTTGAAGTNASVVNSGTSSAAILDFTIPRGNTGATGVSVTGVNLISTQGLQKTYRMTFSDNTYYDYIVTDGASGSTAWGGISGTLSNQTDLQTELTGLQSQIDAIVSSSDVFDIVGTYAELQAYNISTVPVNDIIKVLVDSTHSNAATYYRCVETGGVKSWSYIGSEGAYYTKSETDTLLNDKYDASNPAGYTSNVGTVTSVNNTQPDANGNVTISVTGGANTDLSNLTATGEAHFQEPLISGTNIKTVNNVSVLGSGNIDTSEIFIAEYNVTSYADVLAAYNAGKTIFCVIQFSGYDYDYISSLSDIKQDLSEFRFNWTTGKPITLNGTNTPAYFNNCAIKLTSSSVWSYEYTAIPTINYVVNHLPSTSVGNSTTPVYIASNGTATSTGLSIASSRFDGQWVQVSSAVQLTTDYTPSSSVYSISLTSYLPSGTAKYDVLLYASLYTKTSSGNSIGCYLGSDLLPITTTTYTKGILLSQARTRTSSNMTSAGSCILPVGSSKTVYLFAPSDWRNGTINLFMTAYRRIGTNT